jgi:hypothetical protein
MAHPRKLIREAIRTRLLGQTLAEDRVYTTMTPIASIEKVLDEEGPLIMAYARGESKPEYQNGGFDTSARHTLEIAIEALCIARIGQNADDIVDDMAEQIEALMDGLTVPEFPSGDFILTETQIDVTDAHESILAGVFLTYEFRYYADFRKDTSDGFVAEDAFADGGSGLGAGTPGLHGVEVVDPD